MTHSSKNLHQGKLDLQKVQQAVQYYIELGVISSTRKVPKVPEILPPVSLPPKPIEAPIIVIPREGKQSLQRKPDDAMKSRFEAMLPDVEGITSKILESDLDHTQAIEVEQRVDDLVDWAPNALAWCTDSRFLGMEPYAKQAEILLHCFEEHCCRCSDLDYVRDIPVGDNIQTVLANVAMMEFGKCPFCGYTKAEGRRDGFFKDPLDLVAILGQRAGKSVTASMAASYLVHQNAMLPTPWKSYKLVPGQVIDFTVVATTVGQAEKTLWASFKGILEASHWFKRYKEVCDEDGKKQGLRETIRANETFFWFEHKRMLIYSASNNPAALRGTTRFGAGIDELAYFDGETNSKKVRANGPETYASLNNACLTLRQSHHEAVLANPATTLPVPMMFSISSPRAMNDAIMTLSRSLAGSPRAVRRHWASWEANPKTTKALLMETGDLLKPTGARDFGAQPPITDDPLISKTYIISDAYQNPLAMEERYLNIISPTAKGHVEELEVPAGAVVTRYLTGSYTKCPPVDLALLKAISQEDRAKLGPSEALLDDLIAKPPHTRPHILGIDLGMRENAVGIVGGYLALGGAKFITDFVLEVKPEPNRPVNIAHMYNNLIVPLVEDLNVVAVIYDKWGSLHTLQDLAARYGALGPLNGKERALWLRKLAKANKLPPFVADQYSLCLSDAMMLASRLEQGDLLFPRMESTIMELMVNQKLNPRDYPYTHLALQLATVRQRGQRLLKPIGSDDDIFRAWANAAYCAFSNQMVNDLLMQNGRVTSQRESSAARNVIAVATEKKGLRQHNTFGSSFKSASSNQDSSCPVVIRK